MKCFVRRGRQQPADRSGSEASTPAPSAGPSGAASPRKESLPARQRPQATPPRQYPRQRQVQQQQQSPPNGGTSPAAGGTSARGRVAAGGAQHGANTAGETQTRKGRVPPPPPLPPHQQQQQQQQPKRGVASPAAAGPRSSPHKLAASTPAKAAGLGPPVSPAAATTACSPGFDPYAFDDDDPTPCDPVSAPPLRGREPVPASAGRAAVVGPGGSSGNGGGAGANSSGRAAKRPRQQDAAGRPAAPGVEDKRQKQEQQQGRAQLKPQPPEVPLLQVQVQSKKQKPPQQQREPPQQQQQPPPRPLPTQQQQQKPQPPQQQKAKEPKLEEPREAEKDSRPRAKASGARQPVPGRWAMLGSLQLLPSGAVDGEASQLTGQTVFEAQQGGELVQLQDDASYALDGLSPTSSLTTQRDSAVTLTEMLASRKGRLALRKDGLAQQYLSALAKLKVGRDPVLALAAASSLLALSQEDAHPAYSASTAAAVLAEQLLQEAHSIAQAAADNSGAARLQRLLHNGSLLRVPGGANGSQPPGSASQRALADDDETTVARARHEALTSTQQGVLLIALAHSTGAHDAARLPYTEVVRGKLLRHGVLERLAALLHSLCGSGAGGGGGGVAERAQAGQSASSPSRALDRGLIAANAWVLGATLVVLENATFTAPDSAALLAGATPNGAAAGDEAGSSRPVPGYGGLPQLLVHLLEPLGTEALGGCAACTQALHGCLALLMNLTHGTTRGGVTAVCRAGGAPAIVALLQRLLPSWEGGAPLALRAEVLRHVEVVSVALGVLINLASTEAAVCSQLTAQQPSSGGGRRGGAAATPGGALPLLCSILNATAEGVAAAGGPAVGAHEGRRARQQVQQDGSPGSSRGEGESPGAIGDGGNAGAGEDESDTGQASIVEAYAAMLGGFLLRGNPRLQGLAASLLSGGSLAPVVAAIRRCLSFYLTAGAITESTRDKLVQLLQELQGAGDAGAGGGGGPRGTLR